MKLPGVDKSNGTYKMYISRNFDPSDLRWGHFWDLTIIRQWENFQTPFFRKYEWESAIYLKIFLYEATFDDPCVVWLNDLLFRSLEVIRGQICFLPLTLIKQRWTAGNGPNVFLSHRHSDWYAIWSTWLKTWPNVILTCGQILTLTF